MYANKLEKRRRRETWGKRKRGGEEAIANDRVWEVYYSVGNLNVAYGTEGGISSLNGRCEAL